jgi:hypothetical protein
MSLSLQTSLFPLKLQECDEIFILQKIPFFFLIYSKVWGAWYDGME